MKKKKSIVALIPARGGSKSIPMKNVKIINGRPLIFWAIDAAVQCKWIDDVYVATENDQIRETVLNYDRNDFGKLKCIARSLESATDTASTETVLLEFAGKVACDIIVLIQATSPLLSSDDLNQALMKFNLSNVDSMLSVVRQKKFIWNCEDDDIVTPVNYSPKSRPRRQDFNGFLVENGAFYITTKKQLIKSKIRISGRIGYYEMSDKSYIELDEPDDWIIVENLLKEKQKQLQLNNLRDKIKNLKLLATDCDGVLTDAGMYYSNDGDFIKKFNTKDGMGLSMLKEQGIIVAIITGENSEIVKKRADKLGIKDVILNCKDKVKAMEGLLQKYNLTFRDAGYIGDDINDLALLQKAGISFSVNDAIDVVKNSVDYVTKKNGGKGAVREIADLILSYQGELT